jgi:hypothetical protein
LDIATVNLAVAVGLPGWEEIDASSCLETLDRGAAEIGAYTESVLDIYRRDPGQYGHSEAYFRVLVMITVLQRDFGVQYNPEKIPVDAPFETADSFVHGAVQGRGGTCATLPVLYSAVGRRLGYPIKLVSARVGDVASHLFARWDGGGERFNIEATAQGLTCPPDEYYRTGRYELSPEAERQGRYLESKTPRMELADFVFQRALVWEDAGNRRRCVEGLCWACALDPENVLYQNALNSRLDEWTRWTNEQKPPGFPPKVWITPPPKRLFPDTLPVSFERELLGLLAVENMLLDPVWGRSWEAMRRGAWTGPTPTEANAEYDESGNCEISFRFA